MEATNTENVQSDTIPVGQETAKAQPTQFDSMTPEEVKEYALKMQSLLHGANEESKGRKIKLRELEAEKQSRENDLLAEQGKYKELYESTLSEVESLRPLKDFKAQQERLQEEKLLDLEKKLTATEREELGIFDDITTDKKVKWIELKLKNRTSLNLDTSSSVTAGGSIKSLPQNRSDLSSLSTEEMRTIQSKYPEAFKKALNTK